MVFGTQHSTTNYGDLFVVEYKNKRDVEVQFLDTGYVVSVEAVQIRRGGVKDKLKRTVFGVGFVGGDIYRPKKDGVVTDAYVSWQSMLRRCYSDQYAKNNPTYHDCTVNCEWHNFQVFAKWFHENHPNDGRKYDLDKDIKIEGNREYSSKACSFVSRLENNIKASAISVTLTNKAGGVFSFISCADACRSLGIASSSLSRLINGKIRSTNGYVLFK